MLIQTPLLLILVFTFGQAFGANHYFKSCITNLRQNERSWTRYDRYTFKDKLQEWIIKARFPNYEFPKETTTPNTTTTIPTTMTTMTTTTPKNEGKRKKREVSINKNLSPDVIHHSTPFWGEMGELKLFNFQDRMIHMHCPCYLPAYKNANKLCIDPSQEVFWKIWGFDNKREEGHENYDFNMQNKEGSRVSFDSGEPRGYYREIRCHRTIRKNKDTIPWRKNTTDCYHFFSVFTKPMAEVDQAVQVFQKGSMTFKCKPHELMFKTSKLLRYTNLIPIVNPPYTIMWIGPKALKKEQERIDKCHEDNPDSSAGATKCLKEMRRANMRNDSYIKEKYEVDIKDENRTVTLPTPKNGQKYPDHPDIILDGGKYKIRILEKTVKARNEEKTEGVWECVIIDGNGLNSRMEPDHQLPDYIKFNGYITVHIRMIWVLIMVCCLLVFSVIILVPIILLCPDNNDDQIIQDREDKDAAVMAAIHKFEKAGDDDVTTASMATTVDESSQSGIRTNKVAPAPDGLESTPSKSAI